MSQRSKPTRCRRAALHPLAGIAALCTLLVVAPAARTEEPPIFALTNAKIIPVSSAPIEKGTIVIRNGLIEAVGAGLQAPHDARVIDATGLTIYPGLIDALSDVALEEPRPATPPVPPGGGRQNLAALAQQQAAPSGTPDERQGLTPYLMAADILNLGNRKIESARSAGITTALVAPRRGFFQGQSALVNLSGTSASRMVVRTPVALHIGLQGSFGFGGGYPGSLMGILAFVKQTLMDAQHYETAWSIYNANRGAERPEYNRALQSLQPALHRQIPVVMPGDTPAEIERVLRITNAFNLNLVLNGGAGAGKFASVLKEKKIPVLLSAKFPERDREADPEMEEELEILRRRVEAPETAGALAKAGVQFAFQSGDMANPKDFIRNVSKTIEAGLDRNVALRALTLTPAEIFGVADRLGSIEKGKTANLVVATGDIFDARTRVKHVFVDGQKFDITEPEPPRMPDRPVTAGGGSLTGTWNLSEPQASAGSGVTVIQGATILTVSKGNIPKGSILIQDGKIAEVGPNVTVPAGAKVIDATGQFVMPGIIDCHSHIAISGGVNEGSLAVTAMVGIEDVVDAVDINIYRDLAGGVTTANLLHGSANPIGGRNQVIKLRWGKDAKGLVFEGAKPGIKFALGENPKRSRATPGTTPPRYPQTRMGVEDVLRDAFIEARTYLQDWDAYKKRAASGDKTAIPPRQDLKLGTLAEILRGERLVHAHCYRADEILMLIRVADEFGFKVATFQHVLEGYKVAKEIAAHGAGGSTFSDWWAYKVEAYDAVPYNAAIMTRKGVVVSINSDSPEEARHLNQEAAKCMKYGGLSEQEALALVTLNPAKQLRIDNRVGSIEAGKDADLVVFNHHPLSVYAVAQKVLIDGQVYFDIQKDQEMRDRMENERKVLKEKDKKDQDRDRPPAGRRGPPTDITTSAAIPPERD